MRVSTLSSASSLLQRASLDGWLNCALSIQSDWRYFKWKQCSYMASTQSASSITCTILFEKAFPSNTSLRVGTLRKAPVSALSLARCLLPYRLNLFVSEPGTMIHSYDGTDTSPSIS
jgi:hypothetical protein